MFEDDNYGHVTCYSPSINKYLNDNIGEYIDYTTALLETKIREVEKKIYTTGKYRLFVEKITKS